MSVYIRCDNYDNDLCWYTQNTDRANEYKKTYHFIMSQRNDEDRDAEDLYLCDVCCEEGSVLHNVRCRSCCKRMGDEWLKLNEHERYCRACVNVLTVKDVETVDHARLMERADVKECLDAVMKEKEKCFKRRKKQLSNAAKVILMYIPSLISVERVENAIAGYIDTSKDPSTIKDLLNSDDQSEPETFIRWLSCAMNN